jgi:hypothetical protein
MDLVWMLARRRAEAGSLEPLADWLRDHKFPLSHDERTFIADILTGRVKPTKRTKNVPREDAILIDLLIGRMRAARLKVPIGTIHKAIAEKHHRSVDAIIKLEQRSKRRQRFLDKDKD